MAHPLKHAENSARKFGGKAEDYLAIPAEWMPWNFRETLARTAG